jgi:GNAT superfamily N-acetyltransferase
MTTTAKLDVRIAQPGDEAFILEMIRELAAYENAVDAVHATEDFLSNWLFKQPVAECLIGSIGGIDNGIALFFTTVSTWEGIPGLFLEDLVVKQSARGKGLGISLFKKLANIALERGYARIEWNCLDWNEPSLAFYQSLGATARTDWIPHRLELDSIKTLAQPL